MRPDLGFDLIRQVMATADIFLAESQRLFRPHGLTAAQYNVLTILASGEDGLSQREIGDVLVVDRSNVTGLVNRMEKAGWVKRHDNPEDRRVHRVAITARGQKMFDRVTPVYGAVIEQVTKDLGVKNTKQTIALLKALQAGAVSWRLPE